MSKPVAFAAAFFATVIIAIPSLPVAAQTASPTAAEKKAAKAEKKAKAKEGRKAAHDRQKQCGTEWKDLRAAGKAAPTMTWPKFYSECNKRLKDKAA